MRAALYYDRSDVRVEEIPDPTPGPGDVVIDIAACGICGSDLHEYTDGPSAIPTEPHPVTGASAPTPFGHEFGGTVSAVGDEVASVSQGDTVAVNPLFYCDECRYCVAGEYNRCIAPYGIGYSSGSGGFSERIAVPEDRVVQMPDGLPAAYAALVEPFSVGLHAVKRGTVEAGATVAVFGAGPIGLAVIQAAHVAGARDIYAIEPQARRRQIAPTVGATAVIDPTDLDAVDTITAASDGGVDIAFEVAGVEETFRNASDVVKRGGVVTVVSLFMHAFEWNPQVIVSDELTIRGSRAYDNGPGGGVEFNTVPRMMAEGSLDPEPLISSRIGLEEITSAGFEALLDDEGNEVKILVTP